MTAPNNPPSQPLSEQTEVQSQHRVNKSMTALGITGLVLSSIAVLISWVPIVNNFAAILGTIALPFAIAGIVATRRKGKRTGRGIAIAATILAILSIVFTLATQGMYSKAIDPRNPLQKEKHRQKDPRTRSLRIKRVTSTPATITSNSYLSPNPVTIMKESRLRYSPTS